MAAYMNGVIVEIRATIQSQAHPEILKNSQRFFKETIHTYGVKVPEVRKIATQLFPKGLPKEELWALCNVLWQSGNMEESIVACSWSYKIRKKYTVDDFRVFENWIYQYVNNWASCDTLCNHTVGTLLEMFPFLVKQMVGWTSSENRWVKRAAAVSLIIPARNGLFLRDILAIADALLLDSDDLVQKGYGWMLKSAAEKNLLDVFDFIMERKTRMPRTALRYAIEKMPDSLKKEAMTR